MEFRLINAADTEAVKWLWSYCFEQQDHPFFNWFFSDYYQPENVLGGYDQGRLVTCIHIIPYEILLREKPLPVAFLVGLATAPGSRGGGAAGKLLRAALNEARGRGQYASILIPRRNGFYRPLGWELCYHHYHYDVAAADLVHVAKRHGAFRRVDSVDEWPALAGVYEAFVAGRHGYAVRRAANWRSLLAAHLAEKGFIYVLEDGGRPKGYILYHRGENVLTVTEMAYADGRAQQALFYFLYQHRYQTERIEWNAPLDDVVHFALPNPKKEVWLHPFMAGRIVDVAALLTVIRYPPGPAGQMVLCVEDGLADWNNGCFALEIAGGQGRVTRVAEDKADVSCPVGALAQLVFGRLSARELAAAGRLTASPQGVALLDQLFPPRVNYINEYF